MINWKDIHTDFEINPELISEWEELNFDSLECKKWINAGLRSYEAKYAFWLKMAKNRTPEWLAENKDLKWWTQPLISLRDTGSNFCSERDSSRSNFLSSLSWNFLLKLALEQWKELDKANKNERQVLASFSGWKLAYENEEKKRQREKINSLNEEIKKQEEHNQHRLGERPKSKLEEENKNLKKIIFSFPERKHLNQEKELGKIETFQQENEKLNRQLSLKEVEIDNLKKGKAELEQKLAEITRQNTEKELRTKQKELENLKNSLKNKLEEDDWEELDDLLEAQGELSKSEDNSPYIQKQSERSKKRLLRNEELTKEEIEKVCEIQNELVEIESKLSKCQLENKIETKIHE